MVVRPTSVEDAREITETLLNGRTVFLNMEGLNVEIAQRIIDFTSGSCFAISGNLQKVSTYIFIITPANVDISGDLQEMFDAMRAENIFPAVWEGYRTNEEQTQMMQSKIDTFIAADKADIYFVAFASLAPENYTIVTEEVSALGSQKDIKLPDACSAFNIRSINFIQMLRELKVQF